MLHRPWRRVGIEFWVRCDGASIASDRDRHRRYIAMYGINSTAWYVRFVTRYFWILLTSGGVNDIDIITSRTALRHIQWHISDSWTTHAPCSNTALMRWLLARRRRSRKNKKNSCCFMATVFLRATAYDVCLARYMLSPFRPSVTRVCHTKTVEVRIMRIMKFSDVQSYY